MEKKPRNYEKIISKKSIQEFIEKIHGKIHFVILIKNKPALEVRLRDKDIIVDVKNPVLALTLGMEELMKKKEEKNIGFINELKKHGYRIKVRYKMFKFEL